MGPGKPGLPRGATGCLLIEEEETLDGEPASSVRVVEVLEKSRRFILVDGGLRNQVCEFGYLTITQVLGRQPNDGKGEVPVGDGILHVGSLPHRLLPGHRQVVETTTTSRTA